MFKLMLGGMSALMLLATAATPAAAQDDNDWTFTVQNLTSQSIVYLYMAYPGGEQSDDLLPGMIIESGDSVDMEFPPEDGECVYEVYARLADDVIVSAELNLCGVDGIYVSDETMDVY